MTESTPLEIVRAHLVAAVMEVLLQEVDFSRIQATHINDVLHLCTERLQDSAPPPVARQLGGRDGLAQVGRELADDLVASRGFYALLQAEGISDILVNGASQVYVEQSGVLQPTGIVFPSEEALRRVALWMTARVGRPVSTKQPMVDARLPDGSRLNVIIPPLAVDGTVLSIRRFRHAGLDLDGLATTGTVPAAMLDLLRGMVACKLNILVAGGTGAGKTTMLNALSESIGDNERVVTIEDSAELRLRQRHIVRLETRPPDAAGEGQVSMRALVRNALRMRPDRILVGEVRGSEAVDMLQAMNTGHEGSMSTVHANSPRDALDRIETMLAMGELGLSEKALRAQVARSLDAILHLRRLPDGRRVLDSLSEVGQLQGDVVSMQDVLRFHYAGEDEQGRSRGTFGATGIRPTFMDRLESRGLRLPTTTWRIQQAIG